MSADLHLHTNFSDGTYTPEELAREAARAGLKAIAVTDHDSMEGCNRLAAACNVNGLEFVPGVELTAELEGREIHLLGYFLDAQNARLLEQLSRFQTARQERIREMVERLNKLGIPLQLSAVLKLSNCQSPGRPHVARALVQGGFCSRFDEAFERFLKKDRPGWTPKFKISALDAIALIHQAGGIAVLAHPALNHYDQMIPRLVAEGLDGIECFHSKHTPAAVEHYLRMTRANRLLISGGSDCHGLTKGVPLIGTVRLPYEYYQALKDHAAPAAA